MDERGPAVAAFYTWLATNGLDVECPEHVKFRLATFPWTGRGTRATVPIHVRVRDSQMQIFLDGFLQHIASRRAWG